MSITKIVGSFFLLGVVVLAFLPSGESGKMADEVPASEVLACEGRAELISFLDQIENPGEFIAVNAGSLKEEEMGGKDCGYMKVEPRGLFATRETPHGMMFPIVEAFPESGLSKVYFTDAVFMPTEFRTAADRDCGPDWKGSCLLPKYCEALDKFEEGTLPPYVAIPPACEKDQG